MTRRIPRRERGAALLAVLLLVTIEYEVPEVITGLIGVGFIGAAFLNSVVRNRRIAARTGRTPHVDA